MCFWSFCVGEMGRKTTCKNCKFSWFFPVFPLLHSTVCIGSLVFWGVLLAWPILMGSWAAGRLAIFADLLSHVNLHARCLMCEKAKLIRCIVPLKSCLQLWSTHSVLITSTRIRWLSPLRYRVKGTLQITSSVWPGLSSVFPFLLYNTQCVKRTFFVQKVKLLANIWIRIIWESILLKLFLCLFVRPFSRISLEPLDLSWWNFSCVIYGKNREIDKGLFVFLKNFWLENLSAAKFFFNNFFWTFFSRA